MLSETQTNDNIRPKDKGGIDRDAKQKLMANWISTQKSKKLSENG